MVANQETSTNALRRAQTASAIPELDKGNPPANGVYWKDSIFTFLYQMTHISLVMPHDKFCPFNLLNAKINLLNAG